MLNNTWIMKLNSRYSGDHNYYPSGRDSFILPEKLLTYQFKSVLPFMGRENRIVSQGTDKEKRVSFHPLSDLVVKLRLYLLSL